MELIPQALVAGLNVLPTGPQVLVNADRINRIWSELAPRYGFTALQMSPDHQSANFAGGRPEDGLTIQPPIVQVREAIRGTSEDAHARAAAMSIFDTDPRLERQGARGVLRRHPARDHDSNLGVRHVYHAPMPSNDARSFILNQVLSHGGEDLDELLEAAHHPWGGLKYVIPRTDGAVYTLSIEPLQADEMRSLYIDLDAQFPGPATVDVLAARAADAQHFITGPVDRYLDRLLQGTP